MHKEDGPRYSTREPAMHRRVATLRAREFNEFRSDVILVQIGGGMGVRLRDVAGLGLKTKGFVCRRKAGSVCASWLAAAPHRSPSRTFVRDGDARSSIDLESRSTTRHVVKVSEASSQRCRLATGPPQSSRALAQRLMAARDEPCLPGQKGLG